MIAIYATIAALALAWLAGDSVLGLIVAPRLFVLAGEQGVAPAFAGMVFGDVLSRWVVVAGLCCVIPISVLLAVAAGRRLRQSGWKAAALPIAGIVLALTVHAMTATTVDIGQRTAAELREHPDPARLERFRGEFHSRSRMIMGLEMLSALALAIGSVLAARAVRAPTVPASKVL